jgi:hypothetical protein
MCVGIEVAKAPVDLARRPTAAGWRVAPDDPGITPLVARWQDRQPLLRVLEATGGLDVPVTAARTAAGWPVVVGTPRHARDVAHATGRLATTAAGEAHGLAHVAEAGRPAPRPLADAGCRPPGVGDLQPAAGRGLGGRRPAQPGSWHPAGPTDRLGGPGPGACRAVYEHPGGRVGPSGPPTLLCALAPCRTGPQSRLDRVYASGAHEPEGHGHTAHAMATTLGPHS